MRNTIHTPTRVRIATVQGEAFVTSLWNACDFFVTPYVLSAATLPFVGQGDPRRGLCSVTHGPSGRLVTFFREGDFGRHMAFGLARQYAIELASVVEQGLVQRDAGSEDFWLERELVVAASTRALIIYEKIRARGARRRPRAEVAHG